MEDLTGRQFGPYRIVAPLGEGGMAAVYKAYQPAVDRHVALKVLPRQFTGDPQFLGRFRHEARIVAQFQHPHILPVFDYGESDGYTFLVMPFINGGTLADLMTGQPIAIDVVQRVVRQIGEALDYAHSKGVIHRDIKPSNILMDERGNCLVADFGIARMADGATRLTIAGGIIGTPAYMSPEQAMGETVGPESDIYSVGIVLYEMLTGRVPFMAETPIAVALKHLNAPLPPPRTINPTLSLAVEAVVLKALARSRTDRFQSGEELTAALFAVGRAPSQMWPVIEPVVPDLRTPDDRDGGETAPVIRGGAETVPLPRVTPPRPITPVPTPPADVSGRSHQAKAGLTAILFPSPEPAPSGRSRVVLWLGAVLVILVSVGLGLRFARRPPPPPPPPVASDPLQTQLPEVPTAPPPVTQPEAPQAPPVAAPPPETTPAPPGAQEPAVPAVSAESAQWQAVLDAAIAGDYVRFETALRELNTAPQPSSVDRREARRLNGQALELFRAGRYADALPLLERAHQADAADPEVAGNLADTLMHVGNMQDALRMAIASLRLNPRRAISWGLLGWVHAKLDQPAAAVACLITGHRFSTNKDNTRKMYSRVAETDSDPKVQAVMKEAVARIDAQR